MLKFIVKHSLLGVTAAVTIAAIAIVAIVSQPYGLGRRTCLNRNTTNELSNKRNDNEEFAGEPAYAVFGGAAEDGLRPGPRWVCPRATRDRCFSCCCAYLYHFYGL